ncbi:translation factor [Niveomyces insectorum RCEF 264]|uniref:Translation factor n=1 Tax=Niveomyces insectorum RCEF 264 TaxID=1081102 RepID=A0A167YXQ6_9HYPO|nr:translation factor [Niveomyces insectorum RCEF 264]
MQIVSKKKTANLEAVGEGSISLLPTEPEDMWHANNLIAPQDILKAHAVRKVVDETATGSTSSTRVHTDLTVRVTATAFDPAASTLRVTGVVVAENPFVNLGQYHTLDLALHRPFTLWKHDGWDSVALAELHEALRPDRPGAVAAVVMSGGSGSGGGGDGNAVVVHCSSGHVHALHEVLQSPAVAARLADSKFRTETQLVDTVEQRLRSADSSTSTSSADCSHRVAYGLRPVARAVEEGAVGRGGGTLLVNNALFRSHDAATRKRYVALVDKVKADGGEAKILSSDHESGRRLASLGGIAALLTYPLYDLDEEYAEEDDGEEGGAGETNDADAPSII